MHRCGEGDEDKGFQEAKMISGVLKDEVLINMEILEAITIVNIMIRLTDEVAFDLSHIISAFGRRRVKARTSASQLLQMLP